MTYGKNGRVSEREKAHTSPETIRVVPLGSPVIFEYSSIINCARCEIWMLFSGLPTLNAWPLDLSGELIIRQTASTASSTAQNVRKTLPPLTSTRGS